MGTATKDDDIAGAATAWIADTTRRLAGLGVATGPAVAAKWVQTGATLERLRAGIIHQIAALPRQGIPIRTTQPGISVSHIALAKLLTWALAEPAAAMTAAVADVEVHVTAQSLSAVHIHLIGIGTEQRYRTYV